MQSRVYSIDSIHIESLIVIPENPPAMSVAVEGWVPTTGWSQSDLAPWIYIDPPKDGILDLDFVASPPTGLALQVFTRIVVAKAFPVPRWVLGVRVHSSTNSVEAMLGGISKFSHAELMGEGLPLPWPFPWWAPKAKMAASLANGVGSMEKMQFIESFARLVHRSETRDKNAIEMLEAIKSRLDGSGKPRLLPSESDHKSLDEAYSRMAGVDRGAPGWAHDVLDAIWDFGVWLLS